MLFSEAVFITHFLPITLIGFLVLLFIGGRVAQYAWLILASVIFYSHFKLEYVWILLGSVIFNFIVAKLILKQPGSRTSRRLVVFGVVVNLTLLAIYKYLGFLAINLNAFFEVGLPEPDILLPLAISFFTFQQISYLVDGHVGKLQAEHHKPLDYTLFITFFPQLIAGPIVHHAEMMPQFRRRIELSERASMFAEGVFLFVCGLFKKLVIADSLAPIADGVFNAADAGEQISQIAAWTGAMAYTFQIYFDFSGYSDMAIGLGLMFGIRLPWNFSSPYKSLNISDFWRRWHMTLSRWLRDYLYIPMGGNRKGTIKQYRNNLMTMLLGGLWHGAHWNFVIWGALHGIFLIMNQLTRVGASRLGMLQQIETGLGYKLCGWALTMLGVVVAWVFFRATSFGGAIEILGAMTGLGGGAPSKVFTSTEFLLIALAAIVAFTMPNTKDMSEALSERLRQPGRLSAAIRTGFGGLTGIAGVGAYLAALSTTSSPFLYFNF